MGTILRRVTPMVTAMALLAASTFTAQAQTAKPAGSGFDINPVRTSDVVWIGVGIAAIGAGIGIGTYYAVKHNRTLTGCAVSGSSGLELTTESDPHTYSLLGDTAAIKPGDRVRLFGKKKKRHGADIQPFLVEKVSRDFGPCPSTAPASR